MNQWKKKKTRQDILEELIMEARAHISELQEDMFKKANLNKEGEKLYGKLEDLREEAKKSFIPGYRDAKEAKQKSIFEMLKDPNSASYSEMYDQNEDIKQTNFAIWTKIFPKKFGNKIINTYPCRRYNE